MILYDEITRLRASLTSDGYGNQTRNWATPVSTLFLVHWSSQAASEVVGDEPQTVTRAKIIGDQYLEVEATDRIVGPDGFTYEVDGEVQRSYLRGQLHHVRAFLQRITPKD